MFLQEEEVEEAEDLEDRFLVEVQLEISKSSLINRLETLVNQCQHNRLRHKHPCCQKVP